MPHHHPHPPSASPSEDVRLPTHTFPISYDLHFVPHPSTFEFQGVAIIKITRYRANNNNSSSFQNDDASTTARNVLTLHALRLTIDDVVLVTDPNRFGELDLYTEPTVAEGDPTMMRPILTTPHAATERISWTFPVDELPSVVSPPAPQELSPRGTSSSSSPRQRSGTTPRDNAGGATGGTSFGSEPALLQDLPTIAPTMALRVAYRGHIHSKHAPPHPSHPVSPSEGMVGIFQTETQFDENFLGVQLEPTHARCVFPCFDEPAMKAVFKLSIDFDAAYEVIGPTPILAVTELPTSSSSSGPAEIDATLSSATISSDDASSAVLQQASASAAGSAGGRTHLRRTMFEQTPPLSAYLIAFSTGKFQTLMQSTKRGLLCRVLYPVHEVDNEAWYALHLLVKAVEYFEDYFNLELEATKLDIVSMTDLNVLGMENWGVISISKEYLLVNEKTSIERRQRIARLVAHEVAHQWYGNTVSIEWWSQLWLKEGFCRYLEFQFVNDAYPRWFASCDFIAQILDDSLMHDCKAGRSHPVELPHDSPLMVQPRRIFEAFDVISYGKGASILRMLSASVGDDTVRRALQLLCKKFRYRTFQRRDFEQCVQEALRGGGGGIDSGSLFVNIPTSRSIATPHILDWVSHVGHPYIFVQHHPHRGAISISQFAMPDVSLGILPQLKVADDANRRLTSPRQFSLTCATPRNREFVWSMRQVLRSCEFRVPIQAVELVQGQSSVRRTVMLETPHVVIETHSGVTPPVTHRSPTSTSTSTPPPPPPPSTAPGGYHHRRTPSFGIPIETHASLIYFNYTGSGVFRVDYDHATWLRVMELAPFLTAQDRLTITITLFRLRTIHLGKIATDRADEEAMGLPKCSTASSPRTTIPSSSSTPAGASHHHHRRRSSLAEGEEGDEGKSPDRSIVEVGATPPSASSSSLIPPDVSPYCGKVDKAEALAVASHADRCTLLLEWLIVVTQQRFTNSSLWRFIAEQIDPLLHLLKGVPCWGIFAEFVNSVFHPFVEQGRLTFRAREKSVEFQSQNDLSKATVLSMLLNLSICRCPSIVPEATEICDWVLLCLVDRRMRNGAAGPVERGSQPGSPSSQPPSVSASFAMSQSTANTACSMTATLTQQGAAAMASITGGHNNAHLNSNGGDDTQPFDIRSDTDVAMAVVALQCVVESGDSVRWWRCVAVLARAVGVDLQAHEALLTADLLAVVGPLPVLDATACETIDQSRHRWINTLSPAVFLSEDPLTFPIATLLFGQFSGLGANFAKALLRNTKYLTYLLERHPALITGHVRATLLSYGATYCGNSAVAGMLAVGLLPPQQQQQSSSSSSSSSDPQQQQQQVANSNGNPLSSDTAPASSEVPAVESKPTTVGGVGGVGHLTHQQRAALRSIERMEWNAVWVDYVGEHYTKFLHGKRTTGEWQSVAQAQALSHSDPPPSSMLNDNGMGCGGISI